MNTPRLITGIDLSKVLMEAGIIPPLCRRWVIDSGEPGEACTIYFDCYGDTRLLDVFRGIKNQIQVGEKVIPIDVTTATDSLDRNIAS